MTNLKDTLLKLTKENKVGFMTIEGLISANIEKFINQSVEGILYDLNRDDATALTFIDKGDITWINNYASAQIIKHLKQNLDKIGFDLLNIINQDGDDVSDGEVVDQIVDYLKSKDLYKEKK